VERSAQRGEGEQDYQVNTNVVGADRKIYVNALHDPRVFVLLHVGYISLTHCIILDHCNMRMRRILMLLKMRVPLLILLALSGCGPIATSTPIAIAPPSETPAQTASATVVQLFAPTSNPNRPTPPPAPTPSPTMPAARLPPFSYPIGTPGRPLGNGFFIRHGVGVENTWYNPGYWHTGEDWYALEGDTAGARVYAVADGAVVYAGANYPGRVVIIRHADDLFSMYGHLNPELSVSTGQQIARGALIGTVLRRGDATPNHLHFEIRSFLTAREINGAAPRYPFRCGADCPPGPGYWPINAPDLPSDLGWRNPTHVINRRMLPEGAIGEVVVATKPVSNSVPLWSAPPSDATRAALDTLELRPDERYTLLATNAGAEDTRETSALAYRLWYRIELPDGRIGWVQAGVPSTFETGSDGRPSSVYFNFFPAIDAAP